MDKMTRSMVVNAVKKSDTIITVKLVLFEEYVLNVLSSFAPQLGCEEKDKDKF